MDKESYTTSTTAGESESTTPETDVSGKSVIELVGQDQSGTDLQALDEKVKSMMRKGRTMHYRLRAIRGGPLGLVNFTPHFIVIQIFQILFLSPVSFYTHPNISDIFVGDEINLFNLTFHDIANY